MKAKVRLAVVAAIVAGTGVLSTVPAMADPIYCPNGQSPQHDGGTWTCQNNGQQGTGAGWHQGTGNKI